MVLQRLILASLTVSAVLLAPVSSLAQKELYYVAEFSTFYDSEGHPYTEVYLNVDASQLTFVPANTSGPGFEAAVSIQLTVRKKADPFGTPVLDKNIVLHTGPVADTSGGGKNFSIMDVRRFSFPPDEYEFTGTITDKYDPASPKFSFLREIFIEQMQTTAFFGEVEFAQSIRPNAGTPQPYTKYGLDVLPVVTNSTFIDADSLTVYTEFYNTLKMTSDPVIVTCFLTQANSLEKISTYQHIARKDPKNLNTYFHTFDISALPSQTYYVNLELYNRRNELLASASRKFFVSNSRIALSESASGSFEDYFALTEKEIDSYLGPMKLIATGAEADFIKALKTPEEKKNFFQAFWEKRRSSEVDNPAIPFNHFKSKVTYANQHYKSALNPGWNSDRGQIMVRFGPPNDIERYPSDASRYPYEVWRYNKIEVQSNVIFVFYEPLESNNEYPLLHSNLLGENNNPRWQLDLVRRNVQQGDLDRNSLDPNSKF